MIDNFNSADNKNIKSNNKIKESESIQNLLLKEKYIVIIYFEKLNDKNSLSFLYLTSVYIENIYKKFFTFNFKKNFRKKN